MMFQKIYQFEDLLSMRFQKSRAFIQKLPIKISELAESCNLMLYCSGSIWPVEATPYGGIVGRRRRKSLMLSSISNRKRG